MASQLGALGTIYVGTWTSTFPIQEQVRVRPMAWSQTLLWDQDVDRSLSESAARG